jgi:ParB family chromosome partitioning protein
VTAQTVVLDGAFRRIPIDQIEAGPNARGDVGDVAELAATLKAVGQLQPITVEEVDGRYRLIDGHRRRAAAPQAGMTHLDAIVRRSPTPPARIVQQLAIQGGARAFNPLAEARSLHTLMFEHNMTREQVAAAVGRTPGWVRDRISLVHLEPSERRDVEAGRMSVSEALLRLKNRREMREGRPSAQSRPYQSADPRPAGQPHDPAAANRRPGPGGLTLREQSVLALLAAGRTSGEMAAELQISTTTVKTHLTGLYQMLGARDAANAVHLAYQRGLLRTTAGCDRCADGLTGGAR